MGFAESSSVSYPCRTCICTKKETQCLTVDIPAKHRSKENYEEAIRIIENSDYIDYKKTMGIREACVLNELKFFHIIDNLNVDIMHDLCEGTVQTVLYNFFDFIISKKIISENEIISKITFYNYGVLNRHCVPSRLSLTKKNLNQNASQIKCLIYHIPFIFFDFKSHDEIQKLWICIHSMLKILTICYSSTITENDLKDLDDSVKCHLENMIELFGINLKPKHHHMTHYAHVIRNVGPLVHMSTMKFEMKHKEFTRISKVTNNFRNINKTLVNRHLERSFSKNMYTDVITHAVFRKVDKNFEEEFKMILNDFVITEVLRGKWLKINSDYYESGLFLKSGTRFFKILHIIRHRNEYFFICSEYENNNFDHFLHSIEIREIIPCNTVLLKYSELYLKKSFEKKENNEKVYLIADSLDIYHSGT